MPLPGFWILIKSDIVRSKSQILSSKDLATGREILGLIRKSPGNKSHSHFLWRRKDFAREDGILHQQLYCRKVNCRLSSLSGRILQCSSIQG